MSWLYLVLAIVLEVSGTTSMKLSQGFTQDVALRAHVSLLWTEPQCADAGVKDHRRQRGLCCVVWAWHGPDRYPKAKLRAGATDADIADFIANIWRNRTDRYSAQRLEALNTSTYDPKSHKKIEMISLGG